MKKRKSGLKVLWLILLSIVGFIVFRFSTKLKIYRKKYNTCIFFNGKELNFDDQVFEGGSYAVAFGGVDIDLRGATLEDESVEIELLGEFSGISIRVPADWNVIAEGDVHNSGIDNQIEFDENNTDAPQLIINYNLKYSGLSIRN